MVIFMDAIRSAMLALVGASLAIAAPTRAADIRTQIIEGSTIILVDGSIEDGDQSRFMRISDANPGAIVVLNSEGGALIPALQIGLSIRMNEQVTAVLDGDLCASSCALIWLGGTRRFLQSNGQVGFHAGYRNETGMSLEDGVANALIGRYLTQLDFPTEAVVFATAAPPDRLLWLDPATPGRHGITFDLLGSNDQRQAARTNSTNSDTSHFSYAGSWEIRVDHSLDNLCYIGVLYEGDRLLRLGLQRDGIVYITILDAHWRSIVEDSSYPIAITLGRHTPWTGTATGIWRSDIPGLAVTVDHADFINEFMTEQAMVVTWNGRPILRLDLTNSARAVREMVRCQEAQMELDPFAAGR